MIFQIVQHISVELLSEFKSLFVQLIQVNFPPELTTDTEATFLLPPIFPPLKFRLMMMRR